jgi:hypothetical protein
MGEIKVEVPEGLPLPHLRRKIEEMVKEEELKWSLFEKCREEIDLRRDDLEELEKTREIVWRDEKKRYRL